MLPITGRSFAGVLRGNNRDNRRGPDDVVGWEHSGHAAIRKGDWKLLWVGRQTMLMRGSGGPPLGAGPAAAGPFAPGVARLSRQELETGGPAGDPIGTGGPWKLFNLRDDPGELYDLSKQHPDVVADLMTEWNRYVVDNGVIVKIGTDANTK